jgi:hypothetical protein
MRRLLWTILFVFALAAPWAASAGEESAWSFQPSTVPHEQVTNLSMDGGCAGMPCTSACNFVACAANACSLQHVAVTDEGISPRPYVGDAVSDAPRHSEGRRLLPDKPPPRI